MDNIDIPTYLKRKLSKIESTVKHLKDLLLEFSMAAKILNSRIPNVTKQWVNKWVMLGEMAGELPHLDDKTLSDLYILISKRILTDRVILTEKDLRPPNEYKEPD